MPNNNTLSGASRLTTARVVAVAECLACYNSTRPVSGSQLNAPKLPTLIAFLASFAVAGDPCQTPTCTAAAVFQWHSVLDQQFKQQVLKFHALHHCSLCCCARHRYIVGWDRAASLFPARLNGWQGLFNLLQHCFVKA